MPIPIREAFSTGRREVTSMVVLDGMVVRLGFRAGEEGLVAVDVTVLLVADVDVSVEPELDLAIEPRRNG